MKIEQLKENIKLLLKFLDKIDDLKEMAMDAYNHIHDAYDIIDDLSDELENIELDD